MTVSRISSYMTEDHRHCDELFANAENAVEQGDWEASRACFDAFATALDHHLEMEEKVLFPEFEKRTGIMQGPTQVMRLEHRQIRDVLDAARQALAERATEEYLGQTETLMVLMQQHNIKEEQVLYPLTDQAFGPATPEVLERMQAV